MQTIDLSLYTVYTNVYSVLGIDPTKAIIISHTGTQSFQLIRAASQPTTTVTGFTVRSGDILSIEGNEEGQGLWFKGGNSKLTVQYADEAIVPVVRAQFPADLLSSDKPNYRRLGVEVGQTSFYEGRQFRTYKEFNIPQGSSYLVKAQVPLDIILHSLWVNLDASGIRVSIFDGGAESITLGENLPVIPKNHMDEVPTPEYLSQTTITSGFATHTGGLLLDVDRLFAGNQSVSRSTVGGEIADQRGVDSGTYFFLIENIAGTNATGVFKAWFEERA